MAIIRLIDLFDMTNLLDGGDLVELLSILLQLPGR
jgi:hypothetical protein